MEASEIEKYKNAAVRRIWWIIIPVLASILISIGLSLKLPKVYRASTLILVQRQKVPSNYVREIVSVDIEDRIRTITHQITSWSNLEKIIKKFDLFKDSSRLVFMEDKIENLRKRITVDVSKSGKQEANAFEIFFTGKNPQQVADVANTLASYYITENLKLREDQAIGTSEFLVDELETIKRRLLEKEEALKKYRKKYMGGLPEQLETNLRVLERIQQQIVTNQENLREAENRKLMIRQRISELEELRKNRQASADILISQEEAEQPTTVDQLKKQLAALKTKYTERHPDVVRLKQIIERMESMEKTEAGGMQSGRTIPQAHGQTPLTRDLVTQLQEIELQIKTLKSEASQLQSQMKWYQRQVENTPKREQELMSLKRDYRNIQETYNSLLNRKLEAEIAVNLERKQKGEQFKILDPAKAPVRPFKPNIQRIILMGIALGFALGIGLAYLRETMDTSLRRPDDIEALVDIPVLASLPFTHSVKEMRRRKMRKILIVISISLIFIVLGVGLVLYVKGISFIMDFLKNILARI